MFFTSIDIPEDEEKKRICALLHGTKTYEKEKTIVVFVGFIDVILQITHTHT
jgi:hypothetical protein